MLDFHCHSTASDGSFSPKELVSMAEKLGITHLALTDHDTTDGIAEFMSVKSDVVRIPGIEISVYFPSGELHLVGLFIDIHNKEFADLEKDVKNFRKERNVKMIAALSELMKKNVALEDLTDNPDGQLGRPHIAGYLVKNGIVSGVNEAFEMYLKDGARLAVPKKHVSIERAIKAVKSAGGISVLAHPSTLKLDDCDLEKVIASYKQIGLDGVEAYSSHSPEDKKTVFADIARKHGLIISGGSDFHGSNAKAASLGANFGDLKDEEILNPMYKLISEK